MSVNDAASTWRGSGENHYNDGGDRDDGKRTCWVRADVPTLRTEPVCACVCVADMKVKLYIGKICTE